MELAVAYFKVLYEQLSGGTEVNKMIGNVYLRSILESKSSLHWQLCVSRFKGNVNLFLLTEPITVSKVTDAIHLRSQL
jgi:hypothetical protein